MPMGGGSGGRKEDGGGRGTGGLGRGWTVPSAGSALCLVPPDPAGSCPALLYFPSVAFSAPPDGRDGGEGHWRRLPAKRGSVPETPETPPQLPSPPGSRRYSKLSVLHPVLGQPPHPPAPLKACESQTPACLGRTRFRWPLCEGC